jgi:hypothetical protein
MSPVPSRQSDIASHTLAQAGDVNREFNYLVNLLKKLDNDNINQLSMIKVFAGGIGYGTRSSEAQQSGTSWGDVNCNGAVTLGSGGGRVIAICMFDARVSNSDTVGKVGILRTGGADDDTYFTQIQNNTTYAQSAVYMRYFTGLGSGVHNFRLRFKRHVGTGYLSVVRARMLLVPFK